MSTALETPSSHSLPGPPLTPGTHVHLRLRNLCRCHRTHTSLSSLLHQFRGPSRVSMVQVPSVYPSDTVLPWDGSRQGTLTFPTTHPRTSVPVGDTSPVHPPLGRRTPDRHSPLDEVCSHSSLYLSHWYSVAECSRPCFPPPLTHPSVRVSTSTTSENRDVTSLHPSSVVREISCRVV